MVVAGQPRTIAKRVAAAVAVVFAASQLYLATYHPFDIALGVALATAIAVNAFRFFTPNEVFPVSYRGGKTAHLDVGGRRGEAVRQAVRDQLGLEVVELKPVGLAGSGGSTPLRLRVAGEPDTYLFGKLYAMNHVRADRWYKLGRTILYGRLEDEAPFQTVRRLVEYEDYAARLLRDVGVPTAQPYGIVEMTPEREYLLVTEFFDDAKEIGDADVDDVVIDEGLQLIRRLWDNGLAHRDIKPANLLVQDGHLRLIDVFFVQVRPSPWRQAVDLANMMLVLALRSDAARVYEHALEYFTPDEIAEAFAAARGVASPTQLRVVMKRDGRDLLRQFRELAPPSRPISLQRWNLKRLTLTSTVLGCAALALVVLASVLVPAYDHELGAKPDCGTSNVMVLMAQSVPTATVVPCLAELPDGWAVGGMRVGRGKGSFWLNSDRAGTRAVDATLLPSGGCAPSGATEVRSELAGARRFETAEPDAATPVFTRWYVFQGGCVRYRIDLGGPSAVSLRFDANDALGFQPRSTLVEHVHDRNGLRLCGAGAPCAGGA
jgi:tRNA A-37 threonylcarbamoyl transferase component Bud32